MLSTFSIVPNLVRFDHLVIEKQIVLNHVIHRNVVPGTTFGLFLMLPRLFAGREQSDEKHSKNQIYHSDDTFLSKIITAQHDSKGSFSLFSPQCNSITEAVPKISLNHFRIDCQLKLPENMDIVRVLCYNTP